MPSWGNNKPTHLTRRHSKKVLLVCVAVAVILCLGAAFAWQYFQEQAMATLDPDTLCPKSGPESEVAVLIDRTDGLSEIQGEDLEKRLTQWAAAIPKHGQFAVYEVGKGGRLLDPLVSVCNPGDGSEVSSFNSNPKKWRQRYEDKFAAPIRQMIASMRLDVEASTSPIMEAVQAVVVHDFGAKPPPGDKQLILVTDLLQFTDGLNLYKGAPHFEEFWRSAYAGSVRADLHNVQISIYLLNRAKAAGKQNDALGEFWIRWLQEQGATINLFSHISG
jgi:hypothetical protein